MWDLCSLILRLNVFKEEFTNFFTKVSKSVRKFVCNVIQIFVDNNLCVNIQCYHFRT